MTLDELQLRPDQVRALYLIQLQQTYSAELQLLVALPTVADCISISEVKQRLLVSAAQLPGHIKQLLRIFEELGEPLDGPMCETVKALVILSEEIGQGHPIGPLRDLLLIGIVKELKLLKIAKYTMAGTFSEALGYSQHSLALSDSKQDEMVADRALTLFMRSVKVVPDNT